VEKKEIEDLSNLVFGLALTLGTVTLVAPAADDVGRLLTAIVSYGLSFFIIVWIWWLYNKITKRARTETRFRFAINVLLLFLVVIEPFLLGVSNKVAGSAAYAIDIGTILLVLAVYSQLAIKESIAAGSTIARWRTNRNTLIVCAIIFYATIAIGLFPDIASTGIQGAIWLAVLLVAILSGLVMDVREKRRSTRGMGP